MTRRILAALPLVGGLIFAGGAHASSLYFSLGEDGNVSVTGTLTIGPDPYADTTGIFGTPANLIGPSAGPPPNFQGAVDPANALAVTNITGTFSDAALGIVDATITGLVAINPSYTLPRTTRSLTALAGIQHRTLSRTTIFSIPARAPL
jgi:hypothetical protein